MISEKTTDSLYWYPVQLTNKTESIEYTTPWFPSFPLTKHSVFVLTKSIGDAEAGLYVMGSSGKRLLALTYKDLSTAINADATIKIYLDVAEETPDSGSTIYRNGSVQSVTEIPAEVNAVWTTVKSNSASSTTVTSVNGKTGAVTLVAADVGAATIQQGALAQSAVQPDDLSTVATSGSYDDLTDKPTIPAPQVNADWNSTSGLSQIVNKPTLGTAASADSSSFATAQQGLLADSAVQPGDLAAVATSGSYNDLTNQPVIPPAQVNSDWNAITGVTQILNKPTLGTAAAQDSTAFATAAQGALAQSAVQPGDLASVATSGAYGDLTGQPTIPAAQVNSDWDATSGVAQILNKPTLGTAALADSSSFATAAQGATADTAIQPADLAAVATSGSYDDLINQPTIPPAYTLPDATAATKGGVIVGNGLSVTAGTVSVTTPLVAQPDSALPDLAAPPDETWVNDVLKPLLVAAGLLQPPNP